MGLWQRRTTMWMMLVSLLLLPRFIRLASTLSSSLPLWNILYFVRHITLWNNGLVARSRAYVHSVALSQRPIRMAMAIFIIWIYGIHFYNNNAVVNLENYHFHSVCLIFNVHFSCSVYGCWCCCCFFYCFLLTNILFFQSLPLPRSSCSSIGRPNVNKTQMERTREIERWNLLCIGVCVSAQDRTLSRNERKKTKERE